jgi:hypothetical protein
MKEQFVTYEIALALKELGFYSEDCFGYFSSIDNNLIMLHNRWNIGVLAPLWQQAIDWLRKSIVYGLIQFLNIERNVYS